MSSPAMPKPRTNLDDPGLIIAIDAAPDGGTLVTTLGHGIVHVVESPKEVWSYLPGRTDHIKFCEK